MRLLIDNTTRFFTVVGAPYIPEHHFSGCDDDTDGSAHAEDCTQLPGGSAGSWLQE